MSTLTQDESRPGDDRDGSQHLTPCAGVIDSTAHGRGGFPALASRQVYWWTVHEFVEPVLAAAGSSPMIGTPLWCVLDDDPRKHAALYDAARHWALRLETRQQALCDASHDGSAALDWAAMTREVQQRNSFYAAHP